MLILDPVGSQVIFIVISIGILHHAVRILAGTILGQMRFEELLDSVCVPLGYGQRLLHFATGI